VKETDRHRRELGKKERERERKRSFTRKERECRRTRCARSYKNNKNRASITLYIYRRRE